MPRPGPPPSSSAARTIPSAFRRLSTVMSSDLPRERAPASQESGRGAGLTTRPAPQAEAARLRSCRCLVTADPPSAACRPFTDTPGAARRPSCPFSPPSIPSSATLSSLSPTLFLPSPLLAPLPPTTRISLIFNLLSPRLPRPAGAPRHRGKGGSHPPLPPWVSLSLCLDFLPLMFSKKLHSREKASRG